MARLKTTERYTRIFKALQFGSEEGDEPEYLSLRQHFDEYGNPVEEIKFNMDETVEEHHHFVYENGKLSLHVIEMPSEEMREEYRFTRNNEGRLVKEQKFYGDEPGEATDYQYDASGKVISVVRTDPDGIREHEERFEYENNQLVKHLIFDGHSNLITCSVFENENGKPVKRTDTDNLHQLLSVTLYEYDEKANLLRYVTRNADDKIIESMALKYDERGNMIEKAIRDFHPRTFRYEYDEHNRCISEETLNAFGQISSRTVYEYDETGRVLSEINYNLDHHHSHHDSNKAHRYVYTYFQG